MDSFPAPGLTLEAEFITWPADREIHRVHNAAYGSIEFNPGNGDARFSPVTSARGNPVPTLYGGETFECALMETVFRDVPHTAGFKAYDKHNLDRMRASVLCPSRDLLLVNLSGKALHKLGITRAKLLECEAADFSHTRRWAGALHAQLPKADGLRWVSRQDDEAHALLLFGDRVKKAVLRVTRPPTDIVHDLKLYLQVLDLAQLIGVDFI
jgi:hypothetical protein